MGPDRYPLTRAQSLALSGASLLLLLVATTALGPLIAGSGWWWAGAVVGLAVIGGGAAMRALRTPPSLVPPLQLVAMLVALTLLFGGATSIALVIPTPDTFAVFGELAEGARRTIEQQSVPAVPVPALVFAIAVGVGLIAVLLDLLVQTVRVPALAAIPMLVPVLVPGLFVADGAEAPAIVLTAAAYLLLLRVDVRVRRAAELLQEDDRDDAPVVSAPRRAPIVSTMGASLGLAAIGLVAASVIAAATPSVSTSFLVGTGGPATLFARGVSPYVDLGRDLRRPDPVPAFSYVSPEGVRPYFTLLTVERLEGRVWSATDRAVDGDNTLGTLPGPDGLAADVLVEPKPIAVQVDQVRTAWLPVPYPSNEVSGVSGSWFWDEGTLNVRSVDSTTVGQQYRLTHLDVQPDAAQLRSAPSVPDRAVAEATRRLPDDLPPVIAETAATITASSATPYDAAVAIQAYLRGSDFEYSESAPVAEGYDGAGFDAIAAFLEQRAGYCVHFASTMAVLAREVGIPSRISIGYTAGTPGDGRVDGDVVIEVDSHDLHAWPELYFEGVGWVPFEPTPGRGSVPDYSRPNAGQDTPGVVPTGPAATPGASGRPEGDPDRALGGGAGVQTAGAQAAQLAVIGLAVAIVLLLPAMFRAGARTVRRGRVRSGDRPADAAWRELLATAVDLGLAVDPRRTVRGIAAELAARPAFAADPERPGERTAPLAALERLRDAVERERYGRVRGAGPADAHAAGVGPDRRDALLADLATVSETLRADATSARRVGAVLLPASLRPSARVALGRPAPPGE
ncbi:transglutaminaseTgpA domain-containing protein [Agromyces sp. GXS1127]|uniref:transglutaminase family protein n=1 Tax=Agromyces sp. GXS1127 TaxID=3424181 RepID=UPI003D31AD18